MKKLRIVYLIGLTLFLSLSACSEDSSSEEISSEMEEEPISDEDPNGSSSDDQESNNDDSDDSDTNSDDIFSVELIASQEIITDNGNGLQNWGEGVSLRAINIDGSPGRLVFDTQFRDKGFGVAGARWDQIDYYVQFQGEEVNASEKIEVIFQNEVTEVIITVGMMGANEGHPDGETGKWIAFDETNTQIAEGDFGANDSTLGSEVKLVDNSYGTYPIALDVQAPIKSITIEATGFGYGQGSPKNVNSYNNESGNKENNSDFNLIGVSFKTK
ncbi:hypothetical protein ACOKFD_11780 [Flagellimonas sp. S174]|uniref:hypothetical protein n=1 Tax=Flagellimonas sp. S174 TaxID=3410790 RepID=UPI003BF58DD0